MLLPPTAVAVFLATTQQEQRVLVCDDRAALCHGIPPFDIYHMSVLLNGHCVAACNSPCMTCSGAASNCTTCVTGYYLSGTLGPSNTTCAGEELDMRTSLPVTIVSALLFPVCPTHFP